MKSGYDNYEGIWGNSYYDEEFDNISDLDFSHKTFTSSDSLVSIGPVNPDDLPKHEEARCYRHGTSEVPYVGQPYDPEKFKLVKGEWDHEHCLVCRFSIHNQNTFWQNSRGRILCDACYEHYILKK